MDQVAQGALPLLDLARQPIVAVLVAQVQGQVALERPALVLLVVL